MLASHGVGDEWVESCTRTMANKTDVVRSALGSAEDRKTSVFLQFPCSLLDAQLNIIGGARLLATAREPRFQSTRQSRSVLRPNDGEKDGRLSSLHNWRTERRIYHDTEQHSRNDTRARGHRYQVSLRCKLRNALHVLGTWK